MKRVVTGFSAATVLLFAGGATAQTTPDLSGKWTLVPNASATGEAGGAGGARRPPGTMGSGWGPEITLTHDGTTLTVEYTPYVARDAQPSLKLVYRLDGAESKNTINVGRGGQEQVTKAAWVGNGLVITTLHRFKHPESGAAMTSETMHVLSLESPTSLAIETTRAGALGGPPSTTKSLYAKN